MALGVGAALLFRYLVNHDLVQESLKTPMLLAFALGVYVLSNLVMEESGLGAATILGIALANMRIRGLAELTRIKESLVVLIVSALFVVLTASLHRSLFTQLSWPTYLLTAAMIFAVRPATIALATLGSDLSRAGAASHRVDRAARHRRRGRRERRRRQALGGRPSRRRACHAGRLHPHRVDDDPARLLAGAGGAAAEAHARRQADAGNRRRDTLDRDSRGDAAATAGTPVLLIDTFAGALDEARSKGIPMPSSRAALRRHGMESMREHRIDYIFAATRNDIYNNLVCAKLASDLGRGKVYQLAAAGEQLDERAAFDKEWRGQVVGKPPLAFTDLAGSRHTTASAFFLEKLEMDEDIGDDDDGAAHRAPERRPCLRLRRDAEGRARRGRPRAAGPAPQADLGRRLTRTATTGARQSASSRPMEKAVRRHAELVSEQEGTKAHAKR